MISSVGFNLTPTCFFVLFLEKEAFHKLLWCLSVQTPDMQPNTWVKSESNWLLVHPPGYVNTDPVPMSHASWRYSRPITYRARA